MPQAIESKPIMGVIRSIETPDSLGMQLNPAQLVAVITEADAPTDSWFTVPADTTLKPDQAVIITPTTYKQGKLTITTFSIAPRA